MTKFLSCFFLLSSFLACSQNKFTFVIKNIIDNKTLENVLVTVYDTDDTVLSYTKSNTFGIITLDEKYKKNFKVVFNKNGFEDLTLQDVSKIVELHLIPLKDSKIYLEEVKVITPKNYIYSNSDTLTYNSSTLRDKNTLTIEDMIGKIPGISIDKSSGKIAYHNKEISTILVDGENIVSNNYQVISSNLTDKLVESLQIIDGYSPSKLLKNLNRTNNVAINIKVDELYKNSVKGNIKVGIGYDSKHENSLNLFSFSKILKTVNNLQYNNTGGFSLGNASLNNEFEPDNDAILKNDELYKSKSYIDERVRIDLNNTDNLIQNNDTSLNSNLLLKLTDQTNLKVNTTFYNDKFNYLKELLIRSSDYAQSNIENNFSTLKKINNFNTNISLKHFINKNEEIVINNGFAHKERKIFYDQKQDGNIVTLNSISNQTDCFLGLQYIKRFNSKKAIILFNNMETNKLKENDNYNSILELFEPNINDGFNKKVQNINEETLKIEYGLNYLYKINSKNIINTGLFYSKLDFKNEFRDKSLNSIKNKQNINDYSSQIQYSFFSKKNRLISLLKIKYLDNNFNPQNSKNIFILPQISYNFKNLNSEYNFNIQRNFSFENLFDRNNFSILKSTTEFYQNSLTTNTIYFVNQINFKSTYIFSKSQSEIFYNIDYGFGQKPFLGKTASNQNFIKNNIILYNNPFQSLTIKVGFEKYFPKISHYIKFLPEYNYYSWNNMINENHFENSINHFETKITIRSNFEGNFNYYTGVVFSNALNNQENKSLNKNFKNKIKSSDLFCNILFNCCKEHIKVQLKNEALIYNENDKFIYSSLNLLYKPKTSKFEFELDFKNIFNNNYYYDKQLTKNFIYESRVSVIPRFMLFKASYLF